MTGVALGDGGRIYRTAANEDGVSLATRSLEQATLIHLMSIIMYLPTDQG